MASGWYIAPSLIQLRNEINSLFPNRDKASDGGIGDAAHGARDSDHNPNSRGSVNAYDFDKDGIDVYPIIQKLIRDWRTNYVIFNKQIWSRSRDFVPRAYNGANPHTGHFHISILQQSVAENTATTWGIGQTLEKDIDMANPDEIIEAFMDYPIIANGKKQRFAQHMAELFVDTRAQSVAVSTEYKRDRDYQEQLIREIRSLKNVIEGLL